jgi:hypothetical protein
MSDLQRLTTQFVDTEDRIRLSGDDAQGEVKVLWLTQRLLGRLVPLLCQQLSPDNDSHAEILSSFKQEAAQAQVAQGLRLAFYAGEEVAAIVMPELPMRQWLAILRDQFRVAGWPEHAWPAWTDSGAAPHAAGQASIH